MFIYELRDGIKQVIIHSDLGIPSSHERMIRFDLALEKLNAAALLASFDLKRDPAEFVPTFDYEFSTKSAKAWRQRLRIPLPPSTDPVSMTFDVPSYWTQGEFVPHREVRDLCVDLVREFQVSKIKVNWF